MIVKIEDCKQKQNICRYILENLQEWFGIEESREEYILQVKNQDFFVYMENNIEVGFISLKQTSNVTIELAVMGILKTFQYKGIGKRLFLEAKKYALEKGFLFMQVKTVKMGYYDNYDNTNKFYISLGFKEFEVFPTLWDEKNPCQIYIMSLI